jgi:PEP-CTERM motif
MKQKFLAALQLIGALTASTYAHAGAVNWSLGGDGNVSASGTITFGSNPNASSSFGTAVTPVPPQPAGYPPVTTYTSVGDPLSSSLITGASGLFSDAALGITNVAITGVLADNFLPHFAPDPTIPQSFSYFQTGSDPSNWVSYDNLFYVNGSSPQTCSIPDPPSSLPPGNYGGYFDNYGVMFTLANGDYVDLYSNGDIQATQLGAVPVTLRPYGVVVIQNGAPDYTSAGGLAFATPEPSTWAMMMLGFAGLGFAGYRTSRNAASIAG